MNKARKIIIALLAVALLCGMVGCEEKEVYTESVREEDFEEVEFSIDSWYVYVIVTPKVDMKEISFTIRLARSQNLFHIIDYTQKYDFLESGKEVKYKYSISDIIIKNSWAQYWWPIDTVSIGDIRGKKKSV